MAAPSQGDGTARDESTRMVTLLHRSVASALVAAVAAALTTSVYAAPTGLRSVERQMPLVLTRIPHGTAVTVPLVFAPLLDARRAQHAAPIKALPLVPPIRSETFPALLPLGLATLNAGWLDTDRCSTARSPMPAACARAASLAGSSDRATSLVPGRNKNALYGPAYSFHDFDTP